tara:strand:- start:1122 stop:1358 length:237 start_codon:yes stop_codon:yes gene_type:complete
MKQCKKCLAGAMRVHILGSGFCQECQSEMEWKNGDREHRRQMAVRSRVSYYKKAEKFIDKKWKAKYGDSLTEEVLEHK